MVDDSTIASLEERLALLESLIRVHRIIWRHSQYYIPLPAKAIVDIEYYPPEFDDELRGVLHRFMNGKVLTLNDLQLLRNAPERLTQLADRMSGFDKSYFLRFVKVVNAVIQHIDRYGDIK